MYFDHQIKFAVVADADAFRILREATVCPTSLDKGTAEYLLEGSASCILWYEMSRALEIIGEPNIDAGPYATEVEAIAEMERVCWLLN